MKNLETLGFKHFCMSIGNLPSSYVESLSYYECLLWLIKYLQEEVIPTVNNNSEVTKELQQTFIELKNYVDTYFDNLDVQEEINNKLDEMVEEGTLQEIISEYLNSTAIFGFNTVNDMKTATNLIDGSYAKTLGYNNLDDGSGGLYKIRTITNVDVVDGTYLIALDDDTLVAELIRNNQFIEDITCNEFIDSDTNTKYWITHIPHKDKYGNVLKLKLGLADDELASTGYLESPVSFAKRHKATVVVNGGICNNTSQMTGQKYGMLMKDGVLISNQPSTLWQIHWALGITNENELVSFGPVQTEEEARELNCVDVLSGMTPILLNGVSQKFMIEYTNNWFNMNETTDVSPDPDKTYYTANESAPYYTSHTGLNSFTAGVTYYEIENIKYQKQMIGQDSTTKDIYVITCNGKGVANDLGMTTDKIVELFISLGCDFAYQLDGGGSTATIFHNTMVNNPTDDNGTSIRPCGDFLYVSYENDSPYSDELNNINLRLSELNTKLQKERLFDLRYGQLLPENCDLNNINLAGIYYSTNKALSDTILNKPVISNFNLITQNYIYGFKLVVEQVSGQVILQRMYLEGKNSYEFVRQYSHDGTSYTWREWRLVATSSHSKIVPTIEDGFTISNGEYIMKDDRVCLSFECTGSFTGKTNTKIMTLPSEFAPRVYVHGACVGVDSNGLGIAQCQVTSGGVVNINCQNTSTKVRVTITYDIN